MHRTDNPVQAHYTGDGESAVVNRVKSVLESMGSGTIAPERLAALDHFHVRGADATVELADLAKIQGAWFVLDAGSGIGGPSRYLAARFGCRVHGVDLTPAFVEVAQLLAERTGMADRLRYTIGDVTALPFEASRFDLVWSEHVAMNITDRLGMYREIHRVLKPGGFFAFYDVISVEGQAGPLYPLPWSESPSTSFLLTRKATLDAIESSGFVLESERDVSQEASAWFEQIRLQQTSATAPQGPGLAAVMGPRMAVMVPNVARSVREGRLSLLMGLARAI